MKRVLVFPAGSEIGLEINRALRYAKNIELFGLTSKDDHSRCVYKNLISNSPYYYQSNFIMFLNNIIRIHNIDYIFPANDDVQLFLSINALSINAKLVSSDTNTVKICRSKKLTYNHFKGYDFVPDFFDVFPINNLEDLPFPLFIKPNIGQGSKGVKLISSYQDILPYLQNSEDFVLSEYLPGEEYTIDCFNDINGNLRYIVMRNRIRISNGISVNSKILKLDDEVQRIANSIINKIKLVGAWFFQLKKDKNGKLKLLEIAPRVSGTMGLSRMKGINFPLLSCYNLSGIETRLIFNEYELEVDRALQSIYLTDLRYKSVYIDFDDTIVINDEINTNAMRFLYQCVNKGIELILVTRHKYDIYNSLDKYKISKNLFTRIEQIDDGRKKSEIIKNLDSIFIDDSFNERLDVYENFKIPVFDLSEIEMLIDWRTY